MRKQKTPSIFMKYLEYYVNTYMPEARGLSKNTINSYKTTFTLLIKYMYSVKNMKADEITFGCLDVNTLSDFMNMNVNVQLQPEIKDLPHCILFPSMHKTMTLMQHQLLEVLY